MRRSVDAQRQSADDQQAGVGQRSGKALGVLQALRRRIAAADDGQCRTVEQIEPAANIKQGRRVWNFQQRLRILGVGQRHDVLMVALRPCAGLLYQRLIVGIEQQAGGLAADDAAYGTVSSGKNRLRQSEGGEQFALCLTANSGNQRKSQPSG